MTRIQIIAFTTMIYFLSIILLRMDKKKIKRILPNLHTYIIITSWLIYWLQVIFIKGFINWYYNESYIYIIMTRITDKQYMTENSMAIITWISLFIIILLTVKLIWGLIFRTWHDKNGIPKAKILHITGFGIWWGLYNWYLNTRGRPPVEIKNKKMYIYTGFLNPLFPRSRVKVVAIGQTKVIPYRSNGLIISLSDGHRTYNQIAGIREGMEEINYTDEPIWAGGQVDMENVKKLKNETIKGTVQTSQRLCEGNPKTLSDLYRQGMLPEDYGDLEEEDDQDGS